MWMLLVTLALDLFGVLPMPSRLEATNTLKVELSTTGQGTDEVTLTVSNPTEQAQRFCVYHTPFEGFSADFLEVVDSANTAMDYQGVMRKRAAPQERHYRTVAPHASDVVSFKVGEGYALNGQAPYKVTFKGNASINGLGDSNTVTINP